MELACCKLSIDLHDVAARQQRTEFIHMGLVVQKLTLAFFTSLSLELPPHACIPYCNFRGFKQTPGCIPYDVRPYHHHAGVKDPQVAKDFKIALVINS